MSVLRQCQTSFEIIVCDDASTDNTEEMVNSFHDIRIKYYKNKTRLGTSMNFVRCFNLSIGKYIFTLGDDDLILDDKTLYKVSNQMKISKSGMGKIGTITYEKSYLDPYQISKVSTRLLEIKPHVDRSILVNTINFGLGYYSGLIFDNSLINRKYLLMDHKCYPDHMCHSYHKIAYDLILRKGIVYLPDLFIVSHLSLNLIPRYFNLAKHGRIYWEDSINQAKSLLSVSDFANYRHAFIQSQLVMLPNIKFFTDYQNYINLIRSVIRSEPSIIRAKYFLLWMSIGFLPNLVIGMARKVKIVLTRKATQKILKQHDYENKIMRLNRFFSSSS